MGSGSGTIIKSEGIILTNYHVVKGYDRVTVRIESGQSTEGIVMGYDDGLDLAREVRSQSEVGIIILTGKVETIDKIVGLEVGADDYLTKPFDHRELLARVRTILRRVSKGKKRAQESSISSARFEGWTLDLVTQELTSSSGDLVHLTSHQFQLLVSLVTQAEQPLSRKEISKLMGGRNWLPLNRSVDVLIGKLRSKIEVDPKAPKLIKTVRGVGYKFAARVDFDSP